MYEFTKSVEFAKLKNYFVRKYSYCMDYEDIISLVNYAVVTSEHSFDPTRSKYITYVYKHVYWTFTKYIAKESKYNPYDGGVTRTVDDNYWIVELYDILDTMPKADSELLKDRFLERLSLQQLAKKHKKRLEKIKEDIESAL